MKRRNQKLLVSLIAVCLAVFAFSSAVTLARYAKNVEIAELQLTVVPSADPDTTDQSGAGEETVTQETGDVPVVPDQISGSEDSFQNEIP